MKAIDRKILRDLWRMKAQVMTIALVVACGITSYVSMHSTLRSLEISRDVYYRDSRFADIFAQSQPAPEALLRKIRTIRGVAVAETRLRESLRVEVPHFSEPAHDLFLSLPTHSALNQLHFREGSPPHYDHEVVVSENFALAHALRPGAELAVVINGRRNLLKISGIATSPEFLWVVPDGAFWNDDLRFGIFWMRHQALATALSLRGTFNDLSIRLAPNASANSVMAEVDRLLSPWGSLGAVDREKQMSNRLLNQELAQLRSLTAVLPIVFLGVAAFLLNVLLARMVGAQREQIAALKALGYSNLRIGWHYTEFAVVVVGLGSILGAAGGAWAGESFISLYSTYFRFPILVYRFDLSILGSAVTFSVLAGLGGALFSVRQAIRLPPAEAMRPEAPPVYKRGLIEGLGLGKIMGTAARMVLRDFQRKPLRLVLSSIAIAFATAIMVAGNAMFDAMDLLFYRQFELIQRESLALSFSKPLPRRTLEELVRLPGVLYAEGQRLAPIRLRSGHISRELALNIGQESLQLRQSLDHDGRAIQLPADGIALSRALGEILHVQPGQTIELELLEGKRRRVEIMVTAWVDDFMGLAAYISQTAFSRLSQEGERISQAFMSVDAAFLQPLMKKLIQYPSIMSLAQPKTVREQFQAQFTEVIMVYQTVIAVFAGIIAVAVVYNNARIAFIVRRRDLATMRILGFTNQENGNLLMAEQLVQLTLGIPLGLLLGKILAHLVLSTTDPELFRLPLLISSRTYALAILVIGITGILSAVWVRSQANKLNLVSVLKAPE